jgi:hypothetical protein
MNPMSLKSVLIVFLPFLLLLAGCATSSKQPSLSNAVITPNVLNPGDTAIITVQVKDNFEIVKQVNGIVDEDGSIAFMFKDDGVDPDAAANDGIWSIKTEVPFNAPPGVFNFKVEGLNENGEIIVIQDENKEAVPLSTQFQLTIQYPNQDPTE